MGRWISRSSTMWTGLHLFSGQAIPLHWHGELEFWKAEGGTAQVQIGSQTVILPSGWGIFINANVLHGFRQAEGGAGSGLSEHCV